MTVYVNPRPQPMRLVLADGTEQTVAAWGMVRLETAVARVEPADQPKRTDSPARSGGPE